MKGIKIIFPILGVFLVLFIASEFLSTVKVNGIVAKINKQYDDDFTVVYSEMGNVFLDDDYLFTAKSNTTGNLYKFTNDNGEIEGDVALENSNLDFSQSIKDMLSKNKDLYVLSNLTNVKSENTDAFTFEQAEVKIISDENIDIDALISKIKEQYPGSNVQLELYMGDKDLIESVEEELLNVLQHSSITSTFLNAFDFEVTTYVIE